MILCIIQASQNSRRLPGKSMKKILGKPMLELMMDRVKKADGIQHIVIATTTAKEDDAIEKWAEDYGVDCHRGEPKKVLNQFMEIADEYHANIIVRLTADNPMIDPHIINRTIWSLFTSRNNVSFSSNCMMPGFPRGVEVEVFTYPTLEETHKEVNKPPNSDRQANDTYDQEHVTPFMKRYPKRFHQADLQPAVGMGTDGVTRYQENVKARLTVDHPEDFEVATKIFEHFAKNDHAENVLGVFLLTDIDEYLTAHPEVEKLNSHIVQVG